MQINIKMEVPNPPKNMSKEEWAIRCIHDREFLEKALAQRNPLRKYWIESIQVWMTGKERSRFRRRKDQSSEAWNNYIWETRSVVYREDFFETGLRPMHFYSYAFNDGEVKIERQDVER